MREEEEEKQQEPDEGRMDSLHTTPQLPNQEDP